MPRKENTQVEHPLDALRGKLKKRLDALCRSVMGRTPDEFTPRDWLCVSLVWVAVGADQPTLLEFGAKILRALDTSYSEKDRQRNLREAQQILVTAIVRIFDPSSTGPKGAKQKNEDRDRSIWELRQTGLTFGQIGTRLGINTKVAQSAYKRHIKQIDKQTESIPRWIALLDKLTDELIPRKGETNSAQPLLPPGT